MDVFITNHHNMNEKQENSNYSLDDIERFMRGMQDIIKQAEQNKKELEEAWDDNFHLRVELANYKKQLEKGYDEYESLKRQFQDIQRRYSNTLNELMVTKQAQTETADATRKMKKDSDAVLDVLLQAYKELDIEAMKQFEVAFSQLNDDSDHRFQKQLDCFRKVRREKSKEKKQASVMNIDNRGGNAFLYSHLDDTKFSQIR